jgi:chromosomal replication initiator protein
MNTDLDVNEVWTQVLKELRMQMTRATFDTWLSGSEVIEVGDACLIVRVRDAYAVDWLRTRWLAPVQRTLAGVVGQEICVRFVA